ncbi:MAG: cytochrome bc complex cytochrome b subunit [Fidelibacterota bacterium]
MWTRLRQWIDERFKIDAFIKFLKEKKVPHGKGWFWYYLGGVALFLFIVQVVSGILLLLYYKATADSAFESIQFIMAKVKFGWLVRSIHSWSANLMILAAFFHMFSVFFLKAYRKPRELTWMTGVVLLLLAMAFGFSGYLLPWNQLAFFATKVGTDIIGIIPVVGKGLMTVLRGSEEVTGATLPRFYGIHVAILPMVFVIVLTLHLLFVQVQGMTEPQEWDRLPDEKKVTIPFFPNFVLRDMLLWLIVLNILAVLAVFFPWELGVKADPFAPAPAGIKPEWYFVFMFQTLKYIPARVGPIEGELLGVLAFTLAGLVWMLIPFIDTTEEGTVRSRIIRRGGILVVGFIVIMTVLGYLL